MPYFNGISDTFQDTTRRINSTRMVSQHCTDMVHVSECYPKNVSVRQDAFKTTFGSASAWMHVRQFPFESFP